MKWALIKDNDEWDYYCHQSDGGALPQLLEKAGNFSDVPFDQRDEYLYYAPLCNTINQLFNLCGCKYIMKATGLDPEPGGHVGMRPALCVYERDEAGPAYLAFALPSATERKETEYPTPISAGPEGTPAAYASEGTALDESIAPGEDDVRRSSKERSLEVMDSIKQYRAHTAWAWILMLVEVNSHARAAPYAIDKDGNLSFPTSKYATRNRAQIAQYVSEVLLRQHRTFLFTTVLVERKAYLMRWDRAGVIVTTPFDYVDEPKKLLRFFYRIAVADRSLQGYDPTATLATKDDVQLLKVYRDSLPEETHSPYAPNLPKIPNFLRSYVDRSLSNDIFYPLYKVTCPEPASPHHISPKSNFGVAPAASGSAYHPARSTGHLYTYLVGKHHHGTRSPTGRGGKGFVAYDVERGCSVFMKDYWYADDDTVHPETEVYQKLAHAQVRNVATLLAGGDVIDSTGVQETLTQKFLTDTGTSAGRRHHRLVLKEIGRPLESYNSSPELVAALRQALMAHQDAWEKAEILHRDISMTNILINVDTGKAFLNDWDLCKYKDELGEERKACQHGRLVGTWPYMSAPFGRYPRKPNELSDDIESLLHVFTIVLLRFHPHSLINPGDGDINQGLTIHMNHTYYGASPTADGLCVGLGNKWTIMCKGDPGFKLHDQNSILAVLLSRLFKLAKEHYAGIDVADLEKRFGRTAATLPVLHPPTSTSHNEAKHPSFYHDVLEDELAAHQSTLSTSTRIDSTSTQSEKLPSAVQSLEDRGEPRDFKSHKHITQVFLDVIHGFFKGEIEVTFDKTEDQASHIGSILMIGKTRK